MRGLNFQTPLFGQDKLVWCIRGLIFYVVVDIRKDSPAHSQWVGTELAAKNGCRLYILTGFAHGFVKLDDNCEVNYRCSDIYAHDSDGRNRWDCATIGIDWSVPSDTASELSAKDVVRPLLADFDSPFPYDGRPPAPLA